VPFPFSKIAIEKNKPSIFYIMKNGLKIGIGDFLYGRLNLKRKYLKSFAFS